MDLLAHETASLASSSSRSKTVTDREVSRPAALTSRTSDFWLLGGASILLWGVLGIGQSLRGSSEAIENHFTQLAGLFSIFSIFCNYPHFMISYRFGYGQGAKFIFRHWFSLVALPLGLIALYALAYFKFDSEISEASWVLTSNHLFDKVGIGFRFGTLSNLGTETLSLSVLLMNLTVGWHYSKQVFGCMMVYSKYDLYPISKIQRHIIKASLFSVAFFNFFYLAIYAPEYNSNSLARGYFFNIPMISLGLPKFLIPLSAVMSAVFAVATIYFVFYKNYRTHGRPTSLNLLIPWMAFHIWWIPLFRQNEYYFLAVPFFHSLQYLPFAYRRVIGNVKQNTKRNDVTRALKLGSLLLIGFSAFEWIPSQLDKTLDTSWYLKTWFFMIAFAVFINVHHFFIDSVVWKLDQKEVRNTLLN